ncbi:putative movement protein P4 [Barley yellow dwarf virus SGV]|uniref:Putative movement protein P4 n=2 Tax=Luteovirus TaxID=12036 RepID=Q6QHJ3_9TOMB|nr:putative movement protein P4 [Barley yellow dwarf virus SGV]AAS55451.1 putative movement protein P4 [Barley yellow dwarf virus]AAS55454.1 putative movement protein P4 [Barley yellow dwarf virus SGV]
MSEDAIEQFGQWLWSKPPEPGEDEEMVDVQQEDGQIIYRDQQAGLRYSLFQSTTSKATPTGSSNSAPAFRNVLHYQTEYLSPTTTTRSQMSRYSIDRTPAPKLRAHSLLNSTTRAHNQPWLATLTHSPSQVPDRRPSRRALLTGPR